MTTITTTARKSAAMPEVKMTKLLAEALNAPGKLGNTYSRFYEYSFLNMIWLMVQGVNTPCGTYRFWQNKFQRQVRKGEKANTVLHPMFAVKRDKETKQPILDAKGRKQMFVIGFQPKATVFQFSQTDGPDIEWPELPEWKLEMALAALEIKKVSYNSADGNCQGWSLERTFAINPVAAHPLKTTFHELAHIVLGHTTKDDQTEYKAHRGIREFQAEAVAYLLANELDLVNWNAAESRAYIQRWLSDTNQTDEVTDKHVSQIFGAVNKILKAGRPARVTEDN